MKAEDLVILSRSSVAVAELDAAEAGAEAAVGLLVFLEGVAGLAKAGADAYVRTRALMVVMVAMCFLSMVESVISWVIGGFLWMRGWGVKAGAWIVR